MGITWLASYPKSGSTWIRMFLNAYITKFPLNINSAYQYVLKDCNAQLLQMMCPSSLSTLTHRELFIYRPAMLLNIIKTCRTATTCLKTHNGKIVVDGIPVIPLNLSKNCIYIVRDPLDVVISLSHHLGYNIDETIEFMNNIKQGLTDGDNITSLILTWSKHVESWSFQNKDLETLFVRYEDMLSAPDKEFSNIVAFLGLDNLQDASERFDFALEESSFANLKEYESNFGFIERGKSKFFFREGQAGQWKEILTKKQIDKIKSDHSEMMKEFGYD